jgi:hypothetical protein
VAAASGHGLEFNASIGIEVRYRQHRPSSHREVASLSSRHFNVPPFREFASELTNYCLSVDEFASELTNYCLSVDEFASELTNYCLSVDEFISELTDCLSVD